MAQPTLKWRPYFDASKPVMRLIEDGDWFRIEAQGQPVRFLNRQILAGSVRKIGHQSNRVMDLFEDGDQLRIEVHGQPPRFLNQESATRLLRQIGEHSLPDKTDIIIGRRKVIV